MKRPSLLIFIGFIGSICLCPPLVSAQEERHYTCYRASGPITVNGSLDEADWQQAEWSQEFVDITGNADLKPSLRTRMKMLWDEQYLYVAAELMEPDIWATLTQRDAVIFHDNDFELFLDPDGNGLNYYEIEVNALGTIWDLMLTRAYKDRGKPLSSWDLKGLKSGILKNGSLNDPSSPDTSWTVELALPIAELMEGKDPSNAPGDGIQWRVNFSRVEWKTLVVGPGYKKVTDPSSGKPVPEQNWVWSPMGEVSMHIPERWGWLEFSTERTLPGPLRFVAPSQREGFAIWIWIGGHDDWSAARWDSLLSAIESGGVTGILTQAGPTTLARVIPLARQHGIRVQKWFVALMNNDPELIRDHPEWFVINREGESSITDPAYVGYYRFLCPSNPEVLKYLEKRLNEYLVLSGLDGIHLDYIRYPDVILPKALWQKYGIIQDHEFPQYDYCYCPVCREKFELRGGPDPMTLQRPDTSVKWMQFRYDQVTSLVRELAGYCHGYGKNITAAVFPGPSLAKVLVRQQWDRWPLDEVMPMLYQNFYYGSLDWIRTETAEGVKSTGENTPLYSGLFIPALTPRELQTAIGKCIQGGAAGICLFNYESMTTEHWKALREITGK